MAVRDRIPCFCISCIGYLILCAIEINLTASFSDFFYGILDCIPCRFFIQLRPCMAPVIPVVQHNRFSLFFSICIELYLYTIRTFPILIIRVIPALGHCYTGLSGGVAVGHIIAVYLYRIIRNRILCNGVGDLFSVLILWKILELPFPTIISCNCQFFVFQFLSICQQMNLNICRAFSVLIIRIIPGLASGYFCCLWNMAVRDHISRCHISFNNCLISFYTCFFNCIADLYSALIFCKIGKGAAPVVCLSQCQRLSCILSVRQKFYRNHLRTDTILIIIIPPVLSHEYLYCLRCVTVRKRCHGSLGTAACKCVSLRHSCHIFCPAIDILYTVRILRQVLYCCCPIVV